MSTSSRRSPSCSRGGAVLRRRLRCRGHTAGLRRGLRERHLGEGGYTEPTEDRVALCTVGIGVRRLGVRQGAQRERFLVDRPEVTVALRGNTSPYRRWQTDKVFARDTL